MKKYCIEYALGDDPKRRKVDWGANSMEQAVKGLINNEMVWSDMPRSAIHVFKVDGVEVDEEKIFPLASR